MDSQCDLAPKTFSRLQKNVQGCPRNPPGRFPDGSNSLEKSAGHSKTRLQRLEDHPRHLQDAPRRLQDASKTPQDASKTPQDTSKRPLKYPQTSQHAYKSRVTLLKSAYHVASKVYCNEGCLDNQFDVIAHSADTSMAAKSSTHTEPTILLTINVVLPHIGVGALASALKLAKRHQQSRDG